MSTKTPASGKRVLVGIRREAYPGEGPDGALEWFKVNLPVNIGPAHTDTPSGAVNSSGYAEPGLAGPVTIPGDIGIPLTGGALVPIAELFFGAATKTTPEAGVNLYTHVPDAAGVLPTMAALLCLPPTHNRRRAGNGRVGALAIAIGQGTAMIVRLPGTMFCQTTTMGEAIEDSGNTGSYALVPQIRGVPYVTHAVWVMCKALSGSNVPTWQYEACPLGGTPTFPSIQPGYATQYDVDGRARWQNVQGAVRLTGTVTVSSSSDAVTGDGTLFEDELSVGDSIIIENELHVVDAIGSQTGLTLAANHTAGASADLILAYNRDLGIYGQDDDNKDPLQFMPPGTTTDHADIDVGDIWAFPLRDEWEDPTPSYDDSYRRLTSSHLDVEYQVVGTSTWLPLNILTGTIAPVWPITPDFGPGSKYPQAYDRDGEAGGSITLVRKLRDANWDSLVDQRKRVRLRLTWDTRLIGTTGLYRERVRITSGPGSVVEARPVANPQAVQQTLTVQLQTNASLEPPYKLEIWTPRDFAVATTPAAS